MTSAPATRRSRRSPADHPAHFEPHIQGLRAIAVLLVVLYHVWPGRITGGYLGVDVFFVISGYLITGQLVRQLDGDGTPGFHRIRLGDFWAKRIRRLLPAALLVLVVCAILMLTLMPLSALPETFREIVASSLYYENWALVAESADYLANSGQSIVQHYWSLSVEEQFYVVWPLLLLLVAWLAHRAWRGRVAKRGGSFAYVAGSAGDPRRGRHRALLVTVLVVTVVSYVLCGWYTGVEASAAYFTTYTRMWEFGLGALVTLLPAWRPRSRWLNALTGWAGVLLILVPGFVAFDEQTVFPGWAALVPTLGTALAIAAARGAVPERASGAGATKAVPERESGATETKAVPERGSEATEPKGGWWLPARWLAIRPVRWVGDISYSLYLWHWPLIIVAPYIPGWNLEWYNRVALIVIAVLLAWGTKRLVEDPFRSWRRLGHAHVGHTFLAGVAMMLVSVLAITGVNAVLAPVFDREVQQLQATVANPPDCFGAATAIAPCSNPALAGTMIPSPGFADADGPTQNQCFTQLNDAVVNPCHFGSDDPDALRVALVGDSHAFQYSETMIALAEANGWSLTIVAKGACPWSTLPVQSSSAAFGAACRQYQASEASVLAGEPAFDAVVTTAFVETAFSDGGKKAGAEAVAAGYEQAWAALGAPVVAIRDNPGFEDDPNKCLKQTGEASACTIARTQGLTDPDPIALAADAAGARLIDLSDVYCTDTVCNSVVNGASIYRDRDHMTDTWISTMAPLLKAQILAAAGRA